MESLDVVVAVTMIMLIASMAVTLMTEFVVHLRNMRGRHLQQGIADLLWSINPDLGKKTANRIAATVLTHPLIHDREGRMGAVIHREELTNLLMELAVGCGPQELDAKIRAGLKSTLADNGIEDPARTIANIRMGALRLERSNPELSNLASANRAILQNAESAFVGSIDMWFDQTMDRVSQRFTVSTRAVSFVCSLILAAVLRLDLMALARQGMPWTPLSGREHVLGIFLTALLLSLGAPFWFNCLKQVARLRPKIAYQDDLHRKQRRAGGGFRS